MRASLLILHILIVLGCCGQELSYKQFTVKDGLPGSIVYHAIQDNNGFIWFATNQGVSRFDGRTFRNFSKADGLPDNEILKLYLDKYNNVWFISLMGIPSVFYNDSIIRFDSCTQVRSICEDGLTDSIIMVKFNLHGGDCGYYQSVNQPGAWNFGAHTTSIRDCLNRPMLKASAPRKINIYFSVANDSVQTLTIKNRRSEKQFTVEENHHGFWLAYNWPQHSTLSSNQQGVFFITTDSLYYSDISRMRPLLRLKDIGLNEKETNDINYLFSENDSTLWICSRGSGLLCIKNVLGAHRAVHYYFPKSFCTSIIKEKENGYWITTHNDGVLYLPNLCFHSVSGVPDLASKNVRCIDTLGGQEIVAGFSDGNIVIIHEPRLNASRMPQWAARNENNRIMAIGASGPRRMLAATDGGLYRIFRNGQYQALMPRTAVKEYYAPPSNSTIIAATAVGIFTITPEGRKKKACTLTRATCIKGLSEDCFYWGSLQGMYFNKGDTTINMGKKYPALSGVINHIDIAPDSSVWVSTGEGIVILKDGRTWQLTRKQGLPSNLCKHISFDGGTCWVSTDKGIARIGYCWDKGHFCYDPSTITEEDGLTANDVNRTVPGGAYIWAATSRGVSFFSKEYVSHSASKPLINITHIVAGDSTLALKDTVLLGPEKKRLLVEVSGISFRSGKEVSYEYRLKGLDSNWRRITNNSIEFPALPYGSYLLEVRAIDRWGQASAYPRTIFIIHTPPFWMAAWFIISSYLLMALSAGIGVYIFHRQRRRKREEDYQLKKKMQDLEMMALRAQMNPHFIFNCLTSIQYHIMNADVKNASTYLHKFSTLIRQTLQNSNASMILLRDEIRLLELYLDLEKLRLGERMDYRIDLSPELNPAGELIPPMLVQPYVENAIKHGIGPLQGVKGMLLIGFKRSGHCIECTIEDNGPGMQGYRSDSTADTGHRPMGTGITEKRITLLNALQKEKIRILITDKRLAGSSVNGTIIQLYFPISSN